VIARNVVRGSQTFGISVGFEPGAGNVVRRNRIRGAGQAGVLVDSRGKRTLLVGNFIRGAAKDGVLVKPTAEQTLLRGNIASGAGDDGFDIRSRSAKLTSNRAVRNGALGIEAVFGVIDGGGNIARHNGVPRQCTNTFCT